MLQPTHFGPLPQPLLQTIPFFFNCTWAFLGFTGLPFGQLFTTSIVCNPPACLILHSLHPHSSSSSFLLIHVTPRICSPKCSLKVRAGIGPEMGMPQHSACPPSSGGIMNPINLSTPSASLVSSMPCTSKCSKFRLRAFSVFSRTSEIFWIRRACLR